MATACVGVWHNYSQLGNQYVHSLHCNTPNQLMEGLVYLSAAIEHFTYLTFRNSNLTCLPRELNLHTSR